MSLTAIMLAIALQASGRTAIGIYGGWGAFREGDRCFAIAQPSQRRRTDAAPGHASVASWPARGIRHQFGVRLSRPRSSRARVTLSIGERRFSLVARGAEAWAPDRRTDIAVVAAMRAARSMSIESVDARNRPFADIYALGGAASAIDAAALACPGR